MDRNERMKRLKYGFEHNGQTMPDEAPQPQSTPVLATSDDQWARVQAKMKEIAARGRQVPNPEEQNAQAMDAYRNAAVTPPAIMDRGMPPIEELEASEMKPETAAKIQALRKLRGY